MTAPTEAEMREAIDARIGKAVLRMFEDVGGEDTCNVSRETIRPLWEDDDFRKSEADSYSRLISSAMQRVNERILSIIGEELTGAAVKFAQEHPDAPRAVREPVPA